VARWVKAFNEGRQNVADIRRPGRRSVREEEVYALTALLDSDRRHTIFELARETGLAHTTVLHILKERLGMRKIASRWVPHDLTEMQNGYNTTLLVTTWSAMSAKKRLSYAVSLRWMRHGPNRKSHK